LIYKHVIILYDYELYRGTTININETSIKN